MQKFKSLIAGLVLILSLSGCPRMVPEQINNHLKVVVKNNKPCFYIEEFDDMNKYDMEIFSITNISNPEEIVDIWGGSIYSKQKKVYPLSFYKDENHCIEYGIKNDFFQSMPPLELQERVKYQVEIIANDRREKRIKYDGVIALLGTFYIKNKNGKLQVIMQGQSK